MAMGFLLNDRSRSGTCSRSPHAFSLATRAKTLRFVTNLEISLSENGFNVFRDTSDISPGENFVSTITKEIRDATGLIAVVSASYAKSAWGKAELYSALAAGKLTIPIVLSEGALQTLDEPLQRLLQDTNYVIAPADWMTLSLSMDLQSSSQRRVYDIVARLSDASFRLRSLCS